MHVKILGMGTLVFFWIAKALQKVGLGNSMPRYFSRFLLEELGYGRVVTVTDLVSIYLKDLDRGDDLALKQFFGLQVVA